MVNANRKGREAENRLRTYYNVHGYDAELLRLAGTEDRGDLWLPETNHRIEVKNHRNVLNGMNEAVKDVDKLVERFPLNFNVGVVARPGQPTAEWYVVSRVRHVWPANDPLLAARYNSVNIIE